jgi:hypothetical protein
VARGFDSKSVTDQQEEKERARDRAAAPTPTISPRRRSLELARADLVRRLESAPETGKDALRAALAHLEEMIRKA